MGNRHIMRNNMVINSIRVKCTESLERVIIRSSLRVERAAKTKTRKKRNNKEEVRNVK